MLSVRWNRFRVCSACDKIVSAYAQHTHAIIFEKYSKIPNKMQVLTINNRNFQKPSRNPSNRNKQKIWRKKLLDSSSKKFGSAPRMLSHRGNVRTSKFCRKSKEKKRIFFKNLRRAYKDLIEVKKNSQLSHACVPLKVILSQRCSILALYAKCNKNSRILCKTRVLNWAMTLN